MKKCIVLFAFTVFAHCTNGQIVSSSCMAPDSIVALYNDDADRLTVRNWYQNNSTYIDSIVIPQDYADTILNSLLAVYNATALPGRDTVVELLDIHAYAAPDINSFLVNADSGLAWMQQLENGVSPTGNSTIDSLMNLYGLSVTGYSSLNGVFYYHLVVFESDDNYNMPPLMAIFETIAGVHYAETNTYYFNERNITSTILADHVELIYSIGWDGCPSGCLSRRFWKFNVYYDCSVEYVGSYGSPLYWTSIDKPNNRSSITAFPNPTNESIRIDFGVTIERMTMNVFTPLGTLVYSEQLNAVQYLDYQMPEARGIYVIQLVHEYDNVSNLKVVKE